MVIYNTPGLICGRLLRHDKGSCRLPEPSCCLKIIRAFIFSPQAQEKMLNIYGQNATANTSVTIRIIDINDNKPQFYNCDVTDCDFTAAPVERFFGEIEEHSSVRVPVANLTITAHDPDKVCNQFYGSSVTFNSKYLRSVLNYKNTSSNSLI